MLKSILEFIDKNLSELLEFMSKNQVFTLSMAAFCLVAFALFVVWNIKK